MAATTAAVFRRVRGKRGGRSAVAWVDVLEPRRLLSYDVGFVNAVPANEGSYSPGQVISVTFTFANNGTVASPATRFFALLGTSEFFDGQGNTNPDEPPDSGGAGFGGVLFDVGDGAELGPVAAGDTVNVTLTLPVSDGVFSGGPYFIGVFVGFNDVQFLLNDANPDNNFGVSSRATITIVGGVPGGGQGGNPSPAVGRLDPTFGDDGSGIATSVVAVANVQTLGTVFDPATGGQWALARVGGSGSDGAGAGGGETEVGVSPLRLLRFGSDGRLDTTLGDGGLVPVPLADVVLPAATLVRAADGSVFVAANTLTGGGVAKFTPAGVLDESFAGGGVLAGLAVDGRGVVVLTSAGPLGDGVLLAGSVGELGARDFAVVRVTSTGLDGAFGSGGVLVADLGGDDVAATVVVQPDGAAVVGGSSGRRLAAVRLTPAGQRDARFGVRGVFLGSLRAGFDERVLVGASGQGGTVYLGGYSASPDGSSSAGFVLRLTRAGRADGGFGRRGFVQLALPGSLAAVNSLLATPDRGVLVGAQFAGSLVDAGQDRVGGALVRLEGRGRPVATFGTNGVSVVFELPVGPATAGDGGEFAEFLATREGASVGVPGGRVRSLASESVGGQSQLRVAQLVADGADLAPLFTRPVPATLRPGRRAAVSVQVSNLGTLPAVGSTSLTLSLVPAVSGPGNVQVGGRVGQANVRVKLNAGQSRPQSVRIVPPPGAAGLYSLVARLSPAAAVGDISLDNDAAAAPNQVQVGVPGAGALAMASMSFPVAMVRVAEAEPLPPVVSSARFPTAGGPPTGGATGLVGPRPAGSVGAADALTATPGATGELFSSEPVLP